MLTRLLLLPITVAAVHAANPPVPKVEILDQVVAVKDVCAWPKLTLTPKGELLAAIYNRPTHGRLPGDVEVYASTDGKTWTKRGTATNHEGDSARFNHSIGVTRNGEVFVVSGGWTYSRDDKGEFKKKKLLRPTASRSSDDGKTWTISDKFPDGTDGMTLVPFGNVETGADGALRVAAYSYNRDVNPRVDICYTAVSRDHGRTWTLGSIIGQPTANETDVLHLGGGKWLAAARNLGSNARREPGPRAAGVTVDAHSTDIYASDDDAKTWRLIARPFAPAQHPADLLKLNDGRVLLTIGDRRADKGVNIHVSADGGKTWTEGARISRGVSGDCGYPSTAQLADGTLVTVFYAAKTTDYDKYQMCAIRWRLK